MKNQKRVLIIGASMGRATALFFTLSGVVERVK